MTISLEKIQKLRADTLASMQEVKKALDQSKGDEKEALIILRKRGKVLADKKSSRETTAGLVTSYVHVNGTIGVLVELRCETDFVAKTKEFQELAHDLALHIAAVSPLYIKPEDVPEDVLKQEKEIYAGQVKELNKPEAITQKIINGKVAKYYDEYCLLNQSFVKDESKKINDLIREYVTKVGENIDVTRFARFTI